MYASEYCYFYNYQYEMTEETSCKEEENGATNFIILSIKNGHEGRGFCNAFVICVYIDTLILF